MTATSALLAGRQLAEAQMHDWCIVRRPSGAMAPRTYAPKAAVVYVGRCKVQTYEAHEQVAEVGGGTVPTQRYSVHVPVGAYRPAIGDEVVVERCRLDEHVVGRRLVVRALLHKSYATAYRLGADDIGGYGGDDDGAVRDHG